MPLLNMNMLGSMRAGGPALYNPGMLLNNGRYKIEKRLNKGATAIVYAATDRHTGRPVALKVVQCGTNKVPVSVVRREVTLSSSVAHENMVQLLDVFAEGTELIIVWELIAGPDLLELLNEAQGRMNERAAAFYFVQLLRAVLHMHAMGYCHRDIKPENCMVERSTQRLKLIDFGLSKHLESVATLGVGTPDYMPPEMVRSQIKSQRQPQPSVGPATGLDGTTRQAPPYDAKKVDAWAMGVLLYLLVTGTYPFEDPSQPNNLAATILNVQAGRRRPLPPTISRACSETIGGLLNPDPERRTSLEALAHNEWLTKSAAAHVAHLGHLAPRFEPGNPSWILPTNFAAAPPLTEEPAETAVSGSSPLETGDTAAAAAFGAGAAGSAKDDFMSGNSSSVPETADVHQLHDQQQHNQPGRFQQQQQQPAAAAAPAGHVILLSNTTTDGTEFMDIDEAATPTATTAPAAADAAFTAAAGATVGAASDVPNGRDAAAAAAAATGPAQGMDGRDNMAPANNGAYGARKGMMWLPEFMRRCI